MISSTFGGFMTAKSGLFASQKALDLTGHNITNLGTPGYTRQRLDQVSLNVSGRGRYASPFTPNIGNGAIVTGVSQLRDPFLDMRFRNEVSLASEQEAKLGVLKDLEKILDEVKNQGDTAMGKGGIAAQINDILGKFRDFSKDTSQKSNATMIKSACQILTTLFNSYSSRIDEVQKNLEYDLEKVNIPRVNEILKGIQDLNKEIKNCEILGDGGLELKDRRNLLIDELSNFMKIDVRYEPIQVSDSTYIDKLHISLVGKDGQKYEIINDNQRREFEIEKGNDGKWNLSLGTLSPANIDLQGSITTAKAALENAQKIYNNRIDTFTNAKKAYKDLLDEMDGYQNALKAAEKTRNEAQKKRVDAEKAYKEAVAQNKPKNELEQLKAAFDTATNDLQTAAKNYEDKKRVVDGFAPKLEGPKRDYEAAIKNLDNPENPQQDGIDGTPVTGSGLAKKRLEDAKKNYANALDAIQQAEKAEKPIKSVNNLLVDGLLKGNLEMLNSAGSYDNPPNAIHGIGHFKGMLDDLANHFATEMNKANNPAGIIFDPPGEHNLFASSDGGRITAKNICLAKGWVDDSYGLTISAKPDATPTSNDNILHFISIMEQKMDYYAETSVMSGIIFNTPNSGIGESIKGMKNGDTIQIDGKTYTFNDKADGSAGNIFKDFDTLNKATQRNGVTLTQDVNGKITNATTTNVNLADRIKVNGTVVADLSHINMNQLQHGDTIEIDGKTFVYRNSGTFGADGKPTNTDIGDDGFNNVDTLIAAAEKQNITITGDNTTGKLTTVEKKAGENVTPTFDPTKPIDDTNKPFVSKSPSINGMQDGDKITINGKEFIWQNTADGNDGQHFGSMEALEKAAKAQGIELHGTPINGDKGGEILSATIQNPDVTFKGTFEEGYNNIQSTLGIDVQGAQQQRDSYYQLASSIEEEREAVTGVSLDEEAMNIMRYQQSYGAAARLLTALDENLDTLINRTGVVGR